MTSNKERRKRKVRSLLKYNMKKGFIIMYCHWPIQRTEAGCRNEVRSGHTWRRTWSPVLQSDWRKPIHSSVVPPEMSLQNELQFEYAVFGAFKTGFIQCASLDCVALVLLAHKVLNIHGPWLFPFFNAGNQINLGVSRIYWNDWDS